MIRYILPATTLVALLTLVGCNAENESEPEPTPTEINVTIETEAPEPAPENAETEGLKEKGAKVGESVGEFAEAVKDEMKDAKNEVKDFFKEGQDSAQHRLNERLEAIDEQLEDYERKLDKLNDEQKTRLEASWEALKEDRATWPSPWKRWPRPPRITWSPSPIFSASSSKSWVTPWKTSRMS